MKMKREKITKASLDKLSKTMQVISIEECLYYLGGGKFQCFIDQMVAATAASGYFNALECVIGSAIEENINLGDKTFPIRIHNYASKYHPEVCAFLVRGEPLDDGNTINGERSHRYKFQNKDFPARGETTGVWIIVPASATLVFEKYFHLD